MAREIIYINMNDNDDDEPSVIWLLVGATLAAIVIWFFAAVVSDFFPWL